MDKIQVPKIKMKQEGLKIADKAYYPVKVGEKWIQISCCQTLEQMMNQYIAQHLNLPPDSKIQFYFRFWKTQLLLNPKQYFQKYKDLFRKKTIQIVMKDENTQIFFQQAQSGCILPLKYQNFKGNQIQLFCQSGKNIKQLREEISKEVKINPKYLLLICEGDKMVDKHTLKQYNKNNKPLIYIGLTFKDEPINQDMIRKAFSTDIKIFVVNDSIQNQIFVFNFQTVENLTAKQLLGFSCEKEIDDQTLAIHYKNKLLLNDTKIKNIESFNFSNLFSCISKNNSLEISIIRRQSTNLYINLKGNEEFNQTDILKYLDFNDKLSSQSKSEILSQSYTELSKNDFLAIYTYTAKRIEVKEKITGKVKEIFQEKNYIQSMLNILLKLPPHPQKVYRADQKSLIESLKIGQVISFSNFISTSRSQKVAQIFIENNQRNHSKIDKRQTIYHIYSVSGRLIENFSAYPGEQEILLFPYTYFKVEKIKPLDPQDRTKYYDQVWLTQITIPKSYHAKICLLWIDDHPRTNLPLINSIKQKNNIQVIQLISTKIAQQWIKIFDWFVKERKISVKIISDMTRFEQDGEKKIQNKRAGIQLVKMIWQRVVYQIPIMIYCWNVENAQKMVNEEDFERRNQLIISRSPHEVIQFASNSPFDIIQNA